MQKSFSPTFWGYTQNNPDKAYMAVCPTVNDFDRIYGEGSASDWIAIQIIALFGASSSKDKELVNSIIIFSETFAAETKRYKLSELMLFFGRYKSGKYDNSFQSFDTKRIGNAFFKEFLPHRQIEIGVYHQRKSQEESLRRREFPDGYVIPEGYNSYTWYQEELKRGTINTFEHERI